MSVTYDNGQSMADYEAPHRAFDGHFRAGYIDGKPVTANPRYRALRDCTAINMKPLLETSPVSLLFGAWDSSRKAHQVRVRSAMTGEIIGVLADQNSTTTPERGAARVDPIAASVQLSAKDMLALVDQQADEFSAKTVAKLRDEAAKAKKGAISGSSLGLGAIPPSLESLGFVSCKRIIRSTVLSFSALREVQTLSPILREQADALLDQAISHARNAAGISWNGEELAIVGNPIVISGATAEAEDE